MIHTTTPGTSITCRTTTVQMTIPILLAERKTLLRKAETSHPQEAVLIILLQGADNTHPLHVERVHRQPLAAEHLHGAERNLPIDGPAVDSPPEANDLAPQTVVARIQRNGTGTMMTRMRGSQGTPVIATARSSAVLAAPRQWQHLPTTTIATVATQDILLQRVDQAASVAQQWAAPTTTNAADRRRFRPPKG